MSHRSLPHRLTRLSAAGLVLALAAGVPLLASADGLPRLDRTNGGAGTLYDITVAGAAMPLEPGLPNDTFVSGGDIRIWQDAGSAALDAALQIDTDGDNVTDRTLSCSGYVGRGRFGMTCVDSDGQGDISFTMTGKAVILPSGKLALRKATGRGFSEDVCYNINARATEQ